MVFLVWRQRSEQYLTSSHTASHFLRQLNGRLQVRQTLLGSSDFFRIFIQIPVRVEGCLL